MSTELRDLFNELVAEQPDHGIDLDERIRRGRRHARVRNVATASLATVVTVGVIGAGFAFRPDTDGTDGSAGVAGNGAPSSAPSTVCQTYPNVTSCRIDAGTGQVSHPSTKSSKALATQLDSLVPEHAGVTGFTRYDWQREWSDEGKVDVLEAGYRVAVKDYGDKRVAAALGDQGLFAFRVEVAARGEKVSQPFCVYMYHPKPQCTGQPRRLADGSTATVHHQQVAGKTRYAVRVIRPDGTGIMIESGITLNDVAQTTVDVPVLGPERLLEIAQAITVKP